MEEPEAAAEPRKGGRKSKKKQKKKASDKSTEDNVSSLAKEIIPSSVAALEEIMSSAEVSESDQQNAPISDDTSCSIVEDQQKNDTFSPDEEDDEKIFHNKCDSSSSDMDKKEQYEDINLHESSDHQVEQSQPTEDDVESRPDNLEQIISSPSDVEDDSPCSDEDPLVVDSTSTSSHNHMHEQFDTREDTLHYLASIRSRVKEQLISSDESTTADIEQNVRAIQTLLTSNEEIYNRCRDHIESGTNEKTTFVKANHTVVDAHHDQITSMFQFVTYPEHCRLELNTAPLSYVPFSLDFGVYSCQQRFKGDTLESYFIDYMALFESLIMLYDDMLGPYLVKLKEHLETVQACLSKIDNWLSTPSSNMKYLQQTFGKESLSVSNKSIKHFCIEGSHQDDEVCFQCESRFDQHKVEERKVNGIEGGHRRLCPHPEDKDLPYFMCGKCDADSESQCPHYQVEELYVLREFNCNAFDTTFNISEAKGRAQLEKFLGFIESIAE